MKTTLRIISMIMALICICACFASCGEKLNEDMEAMERGERMEFSEDAMIKCEHSYETGKSKDQNVKVITEIDAFNKSFEYLNCKIVVKFNATFIFDDMTEQEIEEVYIVELPFEGDITFEYEIVTEKHVHSVFNESYEIVSIEGEIIKK